MDLNALSQKELEDLKKDVDAKLKLNENTLPVQALGSQLHFIFCKNRHGNEPGNCMFYAEERIAFSHRLQEHQRWTNFAVFLCDKLDKTPTALTLALNIIPRLNQFLENVKHEEYVLARLYVKRGDDVTDEEEEIDNYVQNLNKGLSEDK